MSKTRKCKDDHGKFSISQHMTLSKRVLWQSTGRLDLRNIQIFIWVLHCTSHRTICHAKLEFAASFCSNQRQLNNRAQSTIKRDDQDFKILLTVEEMEHTCVRERLWAVCGACCVLRVALTIWNYPYGCLIPSTRSRRWCPTNREVLLFDERLSVRLETPVSLEKIWTMRCALRGSPALKGRPWRCKSRVVMLTFTVIKTLSVKLHNERRMSGRSCSFQIGWLMPSSIAFKKLTLLWLIKTKAWSWYSQAVNDDRMISVEGYRTVALIMVEVEKDPPMICRLWRLLRLRLFLGN